MLIYLLALPFLFVILAMIAKWRQVSVIGLGIVLHLIQAVLVWMLASSAFLIWAQSLQLLCLVTVLIGISVTTQKDSSERFMSQLHGALFSFFTLATLFLPSLWQQAGIALVSLLVLVVWFVSQRKLRINLGTAMITWFYTVIMLASSAHVLSLERAHIIAIVLMVIALLGLVFFFFYRFWLPLWLFCFHLGLGLLLLWAPQGSSGLAVLLHLTFFMIALMFLTVIQYFFEDSEHEHQEYEKGTIVTLGFWRVLGSIAHLVSPKKNRALSPTYHALLESSARFSLAHAFLLLGIVLLWCMPPTVLFLTVFLLFSQIVAIFGQSYLWLGLLAIIFVVITSLCTKRLLVLWLHAHPVVVTKNTKVMLSIYALVLLIVLMVSTFWLPDQLMDALQKIGQTLQA